MWHCIFMCSLSCGSTSISASSKKMSKVSNGLIGQQGLSKVILCDKDRDQVSNSQGTDGARLLVARGQSWGWKGLGTCSSAVLLSFMALYYHMSCCKPIYFLKIFLPIHFLSIKRVWSNHWKPPLLQTANAADCEGIWDLFYSRRGPLFPLVAMVMAAVLLLCVQFAIAVTSHT